MKHRPLSITITGYLFIAAGLTGIAYHATEINVHHLLEGDLLWALLVRLLAVVGGGLLLRGSNPGRWLLLAWLAYHVVLSAFHSTGEMAMHALLLVIIAYVLYRPPASAFLRTSSHKRGPG